MTTIDFEAAEKFAELPATIFGQLGGETEPEPLVNLSAAYLATRAREAQLEALARMLGKCRYSIHNGTTQCQNGRMKYWSGSRDPEYFDEPCPSCSGTGLVEAARIGLRR